MAHDHTLKSDNIPRGKDIGKTHGFDDGDVRRSAGTNSDELNVDVLSSKYVYSTDIQELEGIFTLFMKY